MRYDGMKTLLKQYMYKDRMTVSRQIAAVDEEGADDYTMKDVYTDVPCHLGIYEISMTGKQTDRADEMQQRLRVDCSPEYEILASDVLTLKTEAGDTLVLRAGKPFRYATHTEINAEREGEDA